MSQESLDSQWRFGDEDEIGREDGEGNEEF